MRTVEGFVAKAEPLGQVMQLDDAPMQVDDNMQDCVITSQMYEAEQTQAKLVPSAEREFGSRALPHCKHFWAE